MPTAVAVGQQQQTPEECIDTEYLRSAFSAVTLRNRRRSLPNTSSPVTLASGTSWLTKRRIIHHQSKPPVDPALRLRNGYFEFVPCDCHSGMLSASLSSAVLGSFMCALVVIARRAGAIRTTSLRTLAAFPW